jgi:hypothetical protein
MKVKNSKTMRTAIIISDASIVINYLNKINIFVTANKLNIK